MQPPQPAADAALKLIHEALAELDQPGARLSSVIRKALRVARLRNDWVAVFWLQQEMSAFTDHEASRRNIAELSPHFTKEALRVIHERAVKTSTADRIVATLDDFGKPQSKGETITTLSVPDIEDAIGRFRAEVESLKNPNPTVPFKVAAYLSRRADFTAAELKSVLRRISQRVHTYLSNAERQLLHGLLEVDIVEQNRQYTEGALAQFAPEVLEQLRAASRRAKENDTESRSHALTSCRRALHSLADRVYPARKEPVEGRDGKERILTDQMFVSRLWQYVGESKANASSVGILQDEIDDLGKRIDRLNDLSSKGVHANVNEFEVNLTVLNTYSVVAAILRLRDHTSAALPGKSG